MHVNIDQQLVERRYEIVMSSEFFFSHITQFHKSTYICISLYGAVCAEWC